jgi:hypothetical protein
MAFLFLSNPSAIKPTVGNIKKLQFHIWKMRDRIMLPGVADLQICHTSPLQTDRYDFKKSNLSDICQWSTAFRKR